MDINTFRDRLAEASGKAISCAREYVINPLPSGYLYLLYPNQSYDGTPTEKDEEVFPEESLPGPVSACPSSPRRSGTRRG